MTQDKRYKVLILDYGGVYSHGYDNTTQFKIARELFKAERPLYGENEQLTELEDRFSSGHATTQEYIDELATILDAPTKPTVEELQNRMLAAAREPSPEMVALVQEVRRAGIQTALLSDVGAFEIPVGEQRNRYDGFDLKLLSAREGTSKQHAEFFKLILDHFPFNPDEMLFYDDSQYCIDTATSLGIESYLVDDTFAKTPSELASVIKSKLEI